MQWYIKQYSLPLFSLPSLLPPLALRYDTDDQQDLSGRGLCIDPEYDVLWSFTDTPRPTVSCFNPVTTGVKGTQSYCGCTSTL